MSQASDEKDEVNSGHNSGSDGSEELDDNNASDNGGSQEDNDESKAEEVEIDESIEHDADGEVDMSGKNEKSGYAQINDTHREENETLESFEHPQKPLGDIEGIQNMSEFPPENRDQMAEQHANMNQSDMINVVQWCLDGSFKPFLACVQLGYVDKDFIIDHQIGRRIIHLVSHFGNIKALRVLHEIWKADIKMKDYQGLSSLHYASGSGEIETLKYLCEQSDEDALEVEDMAGMTPLMHAASKNSVICFIYLLFGRKANVRAKDKKGCNVVHWATYSGSLPILKLLDQIGILREFKDKQDDLNQTPLIKSFFNKNIAAMKLLIQANSNLYLRDYRGNTPEEFIQRYLPDQHLMEVFLKYKYRQFLESSVNFSEVRNGFQKNKVFVSEMIRFYYSKHGDVLPITLYGTLLALIVLTHVYYRYLAGGESNIIMLFLRFNMYLLMPVSVVLMILFYKAEIKAVPKKEWETDSSVIKQILRNIEDDDYNKIPVLKEIWFDTNVRKIKHAEYWEDSDQYVVEYQKYCNFLQQSIGAGNAHLYFLWLTVNLAIIFLYNFSLIAMFWEESNAVFYYKPYDWILTLLTSDFLVFIFYFIVQIAWVVIFQNWIWIVHANGRRQTINETKNSHNYRYIFKRVLDKESQNYLYIHRYYSLPSMVKNLWLFLFDKQRDYDTNPELGTIDQQRFSNLSMASLNTEGDADVF